VPIFGQQQLHGAGAGAFEAVARIGVFAGSEHPDPSPTLREIFPLYRGALLNDQRDCFLPPGDVTSGPQDGLTRSSFHKVEPTGKVKASTTESQLGSTNGSSLFP
jgi:hypothetical protein